MTATTGVRAPTDGPPASTPASAFAVLAQAERAPALSGAPPAPGTPLAAELLRAELLRAERPVAP